jgi:DNA-directed RNA polymerase subunit F
MRRFLAGRALAVVLACAAVACSSCDKGSGASGGGGDGSGTASGPAITPGTLTPEQAAQVLARVGDRTITLGDFQAALEHMDTFDRLRYTAPERRRELLSDMIDVMLLADEARAKGWDQDPVTQQEIREILRDAMLKSAREGVPGPNEVPVEEVRAYYEQHRADFKDPERRRVSAVVLPTEAAATGVLDAARKGNAARWGELVKTRSVDPGAKAAVPGDLAGDLGFVSPPGDARGANQHVPEPVRAAVFGNGIEKVGDLAPRPVAAGDRFYVVKLTARTDPHDRSFEEAERPIRVKLAQDKIRAREQALLDDLRKQFPVTIDEAALGQVAVQLPPNAGVDAGPDAR